MSSEALTRSPETGLLPPQAGHREAETDRRGLRRGSGLPSRRLADLPGVSLARRHPVLLAVLATVVLHLLFLSRALGADEGGFSMVARFWQYPGHYLYGPQWVDRPPGLIAVFAVANHLGPYGVRLMATIVAACLVAAVAAAARVLGGPRAAGWAAWTAAAIGSSSMLDAEALNGELIASAFVAASMAATAAAVRIGPKRSHALVLAALGGALASYALLVKQDFGDALAFGVVLVLFSRNVPQRWRHLLAFAGGAAVPLVGAVVWSQSHGGLGALLFACVQFRAQAAHVMADWSSAAPHRRAKDLAELTVVSGLLPLAAHLLVSQRRRLRQLHPVALALVAAGLVETVGVIGGGNYWTHYLLAYGPTLAITAGLAARHWMPGHQLTRRLVLLVVAVVLATSPVTAYWMHRYPGSPRAIASWVAAAAHPGDTIVVPYTHADVIGESGLRPVYPYSWSLPLRTLDPHLSLLVRTLDGPSAPTWVVQWDGEHTWGLDPGDRVPMALRTHYRLVRNLCGRPVWLHDGARRTLPPTPNPTACHRGGS
ncbi:hypothetical protein [Nocardioides terrisoli]|uniref:hypothetical protein n=1 Tax=Nocardioides terrisoli TaxID=3388267 RepID=UPI00287B8B41|nr:hypothetical protein [Nocardioides marmorisolisilvae]